MKKIITILPVFLAVFSSKGQSFIQAYQDRANLVTQTNITSNLQQFSNLGIKTTGTLNNANALTWIKNKYISYGYSASQIVEDPFTFGNTSSKNLVITKTGTVYPNKYVIICGHFDSIYGPGVNDNGSGTSIILEAARILRNVPTEYSIKFIHFSGEEQGLEGSKHYVNNVAYQNGVRVLDIKLVFNLDQVGGVMGNNNNTVYCDQDQAGPTSNNAASAAVTQQLRNCTALYSPLQTAVDPAEDTDYIPFERKGEVITGFFERVRSGYPHSSDDTFANTDPVYIYKIGKATVGALQHFAVATSASSIVLGTKEESSPTHSLESVSIYPNPSKDTVNIELSDTGIKDFSFEITELSGKVLLKKDNETKVSISALPAGAYIGLIKADGQTAVRKILIEK
ncbi:M20/M25/M40 family metallo-hydrolase [Chryseobacterium vrystaatense]|uniref:Por secretion system C-terminal sorting domain-containing protein n=1 Tax=Chryseobacterium vrystaatense TaxID=307480 RepID=A0A1M5E2Q8_9FLAO|nr:M20/M25/M40 family metallo-hydrolase [Chryseobacterium vrystaatense]SHF73485.1 Por secretion system C-terminal sorting domain-containing protein [Chryseobacterium vrystaatense]